MSSTLARRRKNELKDLATSLGLSHEGTKDELQERIKDHVAKHGTSDPELQDLVREDSPDVSASRRSSMSESGSRRSSRRLTGNLASLSSHDEENVKTTSRKSGRGSKSKTESDSDSMEDPLSEHQVRNFMEKMHEDVQEAKDLAHDLEETLSAKFQAGKDAIRRASKDLGETVTHALHQRRASQGSTGSSGRRGSHDHHHSSKHHKKHHRRHSHGGESDRDGEGFLTQAWSELKHRFSNCAGGQCGFATCHTQWWRRIHEAASSSAGLVWLSFLVEFVTFLSGSIRTHEHTDDETLLECLSFFTNWDDFLRPFFVYYTSLFLLPTLLSQIFNVDRARLRNKHEGDSKKDDTADLHRRTGLLAKKTTSGLSFFVFKFALTYLLVQYVGSTSTAIGAHLGHDWGKVARDAAEALGVNGGHHHHLSAKQACQYMSEVFRFVPASLSLATAGVGTVLALAETIVTRR